MFYFDKVLNKTVLKSDLIKAPHFFTTRELILKTKEETFLNEAENNKKSIIKEFGLKKLISPKQTHTANIALSDKKIENYPDTDALILTDNETGIFLNFADCTPVILYDNIKNQGAIIHAGWRGTVQKIAYKTAVKMINEFNSNPKNITALIGPSICFECFETSSEIAQKLMAVIQNQEGIIKNKNGKFYADLKEINKRQLIEAGIETVDIAPYCTFHNNNKFFSYRKENKTSNRMSAFLSLKN